MTLEIVPTEETALQGEVLVSDDSTPEAKADALKENEKIIKRNWKALQEKGQNVYRALTIIHTFELWKQHKDEAGKRKYTAFDKYLFGEFGWELSRVRALQIIKEQRGQMIAEGALPAETATARKRTAPEVTSERAAKVTLKQLENVTNAFRERVANIDDGDPDKQTVQDIFDTFAIASEAAMDALDALALELESAADAPPADEEEEETPAEDEA